MEIFGNPNDIADLELELAASVDGRAHFVSAVTLIFSCNECLATVSHSVAIDAYPNVKGVARHQPDDNVPIYN